MIIALVVLEIDEDQSIEDTDTQPIDIPTLAYEWADYVDAILREELVLHRGIQIKKVWGKRLP